MDKYGYPTTRRHPRSMADAFPDERACAIERPTPSFDPVPWACLVAVIALAVLWLAGAI